jgi:GT2 family glycosyltransferase
MVKVGLVVPVLHNFKGLAELLKSVDAQVQPIIIPNWNHNLGVSAGWNVGIEQSIYYACDVTIVANDDIVFDPNTIRKLRDGIRYDGFDLVTAVNTRDGAPTAKREYGENPDFACFAIEPEGFTEKFGSFDENFSPAYFEDNDMHYRLKVAGAKVGDRRDAGMFHAGSVTQNWGGWQVVSGEMFESNRRYYAKKWGGTPGEETYTSPYGKDNLPISYWSQQF